MKNSNSKYKIIKPERIIIKIIKMKKYNDLQNQLINKMIEKVMLHCIENMKTWSTNILHQIKLIEVLMKKWKLWHKKLI